MSESFVDLSYRGLSLAKRVKLTQVQAATGYVELPTPMPVGTTLGIATDDGMLLEATVAEVHEQAGGATMPPGMLVRPNLSVEAQASWWRSRIQRDNDKAKEPPPPDADGKVTLVSARMSGQQAVPELMDDGRDTGVMDVPVEALDTEVADIEEPSPRDTQPSVRQGRDTMVVPMGEPTPAPSLPEEGPRTVAMDAVDLASLGLSSSSDSLPAAESSATMKPEDYADEAPAPASDKPDGGKSKRKRKKRS